MNIFKCDYCGRFISYRAFELGLANSYMITPDSDYSHEEYETYHLLCKEAWERRYDSQQQSNNIVSVDKQPLEKGMARPYTIRQR